MGMMDREQQQAQDAIIRGKVNAAHRQAFSERYPSQVEHCLRLLMERLQLGLDKRVGDDPMDPATWRLSAGELDSLTAAIARLDSIRRQA
jgi:hypothetical protein